MDYDQSYPLSQIVRELELDVLYQARDYAGVRITSGDVHRPGLQLSGFFDYFDPTRIQIMGMMESSYLEKFSPEERLQRLDALMAQKVPAIVLCHGADFPDEVFISAKRCDVTILSSEQNTSEVMSNIIRIARRALSASITRHGVLVEVYGIGVLILGESGVGKSETAIELLKRGHRLIADDAVEIKSTDFNVVQGSAPELIRHYMELRGIGVIDVRQIFGVGAIKDRQNIHLVVNLEQWKEGAVYDRLGINEQTVNILGVEVASLTIPVRPGRNLAVILEVAAMNQRQKFMGFNAALEFTKQINRHLDEKAKNRL
ncbi:MAG: HPr(Ser) kinase/phosphatase [Oscillospiraceae bacterium]|jgi:HPr kinase/phosphorylase|nr:HPr(Ser) kinase/phosphatase [Oscillospiraceae bacterium]